jgi:hypothetical protein
MYTLVFEKRRVRDNFTHLNSALIVREWIYRSEHTSKIPGCIIGIFGADLNRELRLIF